MFLKKFTKIEYSPVIKTPQKNIIVYNHNNIEEIGTIPQSIVVLNFEILCQINLFLDFIKKKIPREFTTDNEEIILYIHYNSKEKKKLSESQKIELNKRFKYLSNKIQVFF